MATVDRRPSDPAKVPGMTAQTETKLRPTVGTREAADILGVPQRTVVRWADEGKFGRVGRIPVGNGAGMMTLKRRNVERFRDERAAEVES